MSDYAQLMLYQQAQHLPDARRAEFMMAYQAQRKDRAIAFLLSFFLGWWGLDRFYLGQVGLGLAKALSFAGFGLWWFIDLFLIMHAADRRNADTVVNLAAMYMPALPEPDRPRADS
ncbi:MAG TPA: TM2 domain-containing protein [Polyangiaceae bacterium]|nr:TM2 domain-containing protein [Polyangiaceae bacterium]